MKIYQKKSQGLDFLESRQLLAQENDIENNANFNITVINDGITDLFLNFLITQFTENCYFTPVLCGYVMAIHGLLDYYSKNSIQIHDDLKTILDSTSNQLTNINFQETATHTAQTLFRFFADYSGLNTIPTIINECPQQPYACTAMIGGTLLSGALTYYGYTTPIMFNDWLSTLIQKYPEILTVTSLLNTPSSSITNKATTVLVTPQYDQETQAFIDHINTLKKPSFKQEISKNSVESFKSTNNQKGLIDLITQKIFSNDEGSVQKTITDLNSKLKFEQKSFLNQAFGQAKTNIKTYEKIIDSSHQKVKIMTFNQSPKQEPHTLDIFLQTMTQLWTLKAEWEVFKWIENIITTILNRETIPNMPLPIDLDWHLNDLFLIGFSHKTLLRINNPSTDEASIFKETVFEILRNNLDALCSIAEIIAIKQKTHPMTIKINDNQDKSWSLMLDLIKFYNQIKINPQINETSITYCQIQSYLSLVAFYQRHLSHNAEIQKCCEKFNELSYLIYSHNLNIPQQSPHSRTDCLNKIPEHLFSELETRNNVELALIAKHQNQTPQEVKNQIIQFSDELWEESWYNFYHHLIIL